jgi:pimeloyl-ACP methyl ester carboxylesterase
MPIAHRAARLACAALFLAGSAAFAATPPGQPKSGPGGADNPGIEIVKRGIGTPSNAAYVYYGKDGRAEPRPVIVMLHAWGAVNPSIYAGWIDHLARRGYLVVFPSFQDVGRTRPVDASARMESLVKNVLAALGTDPDVKPDLTKVAVIGHSAGAGIAANFAANAKTSGLPAPRLVLMVMAGGIASDEKSRGVQIGDLAQIDPATNLVAIVGDREAQASERISRRLLREASAVPQTRKLFVRIGSDDHGFPALSATLASPGAPLDGYDSAAIKWPPEPPRDPKAPREPAPRWSADMVLTGEQTVLVSQLVRNGTDTLDYLGLWRSFDMAADAAFASNDVAALRNDGAFVDMGRWSDSWPVRRIAAEMPRAVDPATAARATPVAPVSAKTPVKRSGSRNR